MAPHLIRQTNTYISIHLLFCVTRFWYIVVLYLHEPLGRECASLEHWFINAANTTVTIVMISATWLWFVLKCRRAYHLWWRNPFIHCRTQEVIPLCIPLLTQVVRLLWAAFLLKDDYPEWCQAGGEKIDPNNGIPARGSQCTLFPSVLLTNWVTSSPHPLFTADQPFLASMDLIIIPMSILNMWHKFHHGGLSIEGHRRTKATGERLKQRTRFIYMEMTVWFGELNKYGLSSKTGEWERNKQVLCRYVL